MNIREVLKYGLNRIKANTEDKYCIPELDSQLLLMEVLNKDKMYMLIHDDEQVSAEDFRLYEEYLNKRISGIPLQYIIKKQEFMGFDFFVDDGVLIPRNDTEILVEEICDLSRKYFKNKDKIKIFEIGTGSGAISLSLARLISNSDVLTIDVSLDAIKIAEKNKENMKLKNVSILHKDIFEDIDDIIRRGPFDIIVSNPPYIESEVIEGLQKEVKENEPMLALDGGSDGLIFYRRIADIISSLLAKGGFLAVEIGHNQGEAVIELFKNGYEDFEKVEVIKDLSGLDRVVIGK